MINRFAYTSMTGGTASNAQLAVTANNLANAQTPGFRELISAYRTDPIKGVGADTRAFVADTTPGNNFTTGQIKTTGNPYDMAIRGDGLFVVRKPDGTEAYTKSGQFFVNEQGVLQAGRDVPVVGTGGNITIPPNAIVQIAEDGQIFTQLPGTQFLNQAGKLKLVNPNPADLVRDEDGLFNLPGGQAANDGTVKVIQGALELSNVNPAQSMVQIIAQTRLNDLNIRSIQAADTNARSAVSLLSLSKS
jgi:flagellar basal-body rod protein FlgF